MGWTKQQEATEQVTARAQKVNLKLIFGVITFAVAFTVGFYRLFTWVATMAENHRRDGERITDLIKVRANEQNHHY